jgi:stage II sporulation protein Q
MSDQNKNVQETKDVRESKDAAPVVAPAFSWKRVLGKKWVFPAVYMVAAALILTLVWVYQGGTGNKIDDAGINQTVNNPINNQDEAAVPVTAQVETMQWPVKDRGELEMIMSFYEEKAGTDVKQAALVEYGDTFTPHLGIDLARQDDKDFDVLAALSGKVTLVEKNPLVGYQVEITHSNGLVTVYQSLANVSVQKGAEVKKGDLIAKAGRNELEKDHGTHLHFEVRQGTSGASVNPEQYLTAVDAAASSSVKSDTTAKADSNAKTGEVKTESAGTDAAKTDAAKTDAAKTDAAKTDAAKSDAVQGGTTTGTADKQTDASAKK